MLARNPVTVGGTTAFMVALFYVSANALWYQPHFHHGAFFATRPARTQLLQQAPGVASVPGKRRQGHDDDRHRSQPEAADGPIAAKISAADATVQKVQTLLANLDLYSGPLDGIAGPQTSQAIQAYQKIVGLEQTGTVNDQLLAQLGARPTAPDIAPKPQPRPDITVRSKRMPHQHVHPARTRASCASRPA